MADNTIKAIAESLQNNNYILSDSILNLIQPYKIGRSVAMQMSFHSQEVVSHIRLLGYDIVS